MKTHRVLGVAGHIDHGKTALVKSLTGTETDRLPEEKKRGITIENGFAQWTLSGDDDEVETVSIIDMPGHEKFVRHMVAGASGIDAVMLVVAADDGVMPQTLEHLSVCSLMGVERGIIVISKIDLVDEEMAELAALDVQESVEGTFLENAPIVYVSAHKGQGIAELRTQMQTLLHAMPKRDEVACVYFPIDRVFSKPGFGDVVTGTLSSGVLRVGDVLDALPSNPAAKGEGVKVRGLQVHGQDRELVESGHRVAINLKGSARRGDALTSPARVPVSENLLVDITLLKDALPINERDEVTVHIGTSETLALASAIGQESLLPGERGVLRLAAAEPLAAFADQRVVLRKPGAHGQATLGGGRVLDPLPRVGKGAYARWDRLRQGLLSDDLATRAYTLVEDARERGIAQDELLRRLPLSVQDAGALLGDKVSGDDVVVANVFIERAKTQIKEACAAYHKKHPLLFAVAAKELETQLPEVGRGIADLAVNALVASGELERIPGGVRMRGHDPQSGEAGQTLSVVERVYQSAGLEPLTDDKAREASKLESKAFKDAARALVAGGRLARSGELYFHVSGLEILSAKVRAHFEEHEGLSTSDLKELAGGVSRKFAIPLLEWLDKTGVTKRAGDKRVKGRSA